VVRVRRICKQRRKAAKFQTEHQPDAGAVDGVAGTKTRAALAAELVAKVTPVG
jgi:hypothetical protein